jgi:hypothetical protein
LFSLFRSFASPPSLFSEFSLPSATLIRDSPHLSFASDQPRLDVLLTFTTLCSLWVYHRDFGATFSVIYGK